jgi:hypothetical protein
MIEFDWLARKTMKSAYQGVLSGKKIGHGLKPKMER